MDAAFDPRFLYARSLDQLAEVVSRLSAEQLDLPTPCDEYDLRALLGHTVGVAHRVAYIGEGGQAMDVASQVGRVADTDWAGAVDRARERVAAAWTADEMLDREVDVPWGRVPGRAALAGFVVETVTHTWDVAQVLDPRARLDEELGLFALGVAQRVIPADARGDGARFGTVRPVPQDADTYRKLAGWLGRDV